MTASLRELEAEISHKNHMAEDSARSVIVLKQEIKVSNKQIAELGYSRATLTDGMALKITELEEATLQSRQKLEGDIVKNIQATTPMPQQGIETDLVYNLQDQMLRKDAVVGDLQEQVSEAHSTNSDLLAHNIQLNIHQCHTLFSSFTAISEGTQKTLQGGPSSTTSSQVDTPKVDWWAWAGSRGVSSTVRIDVTFKTLFVWFELIVYPEELTWGSSKKSQVKKNLFINSCKSIKQNDHVESDHVF
ncbi:hypothetical protein K438DRAFT_1779088 [Mycena galopus ATCC 62051]|nr:hypothetical protein K438DRAFT_1779088 [Mycena galopus ATCC 62051]